VELLAVPIDTPADANVIIGQSHFIKTVDDLHEALAGSSPQLRFGIAFCEASGARLVRRSGNDEELTQQAVAGAQAIAAGHVFVVVLREGYPVNVLNTIKQVPEVCHVFAATANPLEVLVAVTEQGRGVIGVVDGQPPVGVETEADVADRRALLRDLGYKL
jgi:adenosine/AMP kinase